MLSSQQINLYHQHGYLVLDELFTENEMDLLKSAASKIVDDFDPDSTRAIFSTKDQDSNRDQYFLTSANKIRCFFEQDAFDLDGNLQQHKSLSINKIGHALHVLNDDFKTFSHDQRIKQIAHQLGLAKPQIHQSMYIFKQPKIGGVIRWHQDVSYFMTDPVSVTTFWFAVEDATLENGCLQVYSGSENFPIKEQFVRYADDTTELKILNDTPWPADQSALPLEVKKGTLVVFAGNLPHFSAPNLSDKSRHAYTLHLTCADTEYAHENWLQAPPSRLY